MNGLLMGLMSFALMLFQNISAQNLDSAKVLGNSGKEVYSPRYAFYDLGYRSVSNNGRWVTFYKNYDGNSDTLVIANTDGSERMIYRTKVKEQIWMEGDRTAVTTIQGTELLDLLDRSSVVLPPADKVWFLKGSHSLLLYRGHVLEVYDSRNGKKLNGFEDTEQVFMDGDVAFLSRKKNDGFDLYQLVGKELRYITGTEFPVFKVERTDSGALVVHQRRKDGVVDLMYRSPTGDKSFSLASLIALGAKNINVTERKDRALFLKLEIPLPEVGTPIPEIWSTADRRLDQRFTKTERQYYLWYPKQDMITRLGNERLDRVVDIGNKHHFLTYDPSRFQDHTRRSIPSVLYRMDVRDSALKTIDTVKGKVFTSPDGQRILYKKGSLWKLVAIDDLNAVTIDDKDFDTPYFVGHDKVWFDGGKGIWEYDRLKNALKQKYKAGGCDHRYRILNASSKKLNAGHSSEPAFFLNTLDRDKVLIEEKDANRQETAILLGKSGQLHELRRTDSRLTFIPALSTHDAFVLIEENYNVPKKLVKLQLGKSSVSIFRSNKADKDVFRIRTEMVDFTNSRGVKLQGLLYYPLDFDDSKQFPMLVHVYETQSDKRNIYPMLRYEESSVGFNIRSLIEKGYFVWMPDLALDDRGTGLSSLDGLESGLDALAYIGNIDFGSVALMGHSFGGYQVDFIATQSHRFRTYISGSGIADIVRSYFSFNYSFLSPFFWQFEDWQFELGDSYSQRKGLYLNNDPIHFVEQVSAPMLLWTGKKDQTVDWGHTMEFYLGLKRNHKNAVALFYQDEPHHMTRMETARDLHFKVLDWLDYHLKDDTSQKEWIRY